MKKSPKKSFILRNHDGSINRHAVSTFIALIAAGIVLGVNILSGVTEIELLFFYPAFVVFLGERIGAILNNSDLAEKMSKTQEDMGVSIGKFSDEIISNIRGASEVVKFPDLDSAVSSIYRDISYASEVKNLFIGDRDQERALGAQRLAPQQLYKKFLRGENAVEWRDVVGISEIYSQRYRKLNLNKTNAKVTIKILRHSPPLINFIVLKYPEKNGVKNFREVYFGWIGGIEKDEAFFYSCDEDIVDLFDNERDILSKTYGWSDKYVDAEVVANGARSSVKVISGIDLVDKAGWWVTCSRQGNTVTRYGVFRVVFEGTGTKIIGYIFDGQREMLNKIGHSKEISHYKDRIHFEYLEDNKLDGTISGTCGYRFHAIGEEPHLSGYVTRHDDQIKREIIGYKMPSHLKPENAEDMSAIKAALDSEFEKLNRLSLERNNKNQ